ncbi:MAG: FMN-binding protein [Epulopiscium sp.]|nr:FMN-binding protein [Candidatus Epulonipiscium sp.]
MKKILTLGLALGLSLTVLAGCNTQKKVETPDNTNPQTEQPVAVKYTDGTYTAEGEADERGWKPVISIEVNDSKITAVDYNEINQEGTEKQNDEEYNKNMKDVVNIGPAEAFPQLEASLVEKQDVDAVDTVSGATGTTESFKNMAKKALETAK